MTRDAVSRHVGLAAAVLGIGIVIALADRTPASAAQKEKEPDPADLSWIGASACQQCHNEANPEKNPAYVKTEGFKFVRLWENLVWSNADLHSQAFKNLDVSKNSIAKKMEDKFKKLKGDTYKIAEDVSCLACHASISKPYATLKPTERVATAYQTEDGVGCEMCHGHGSAYRFLHGKDEPVKAPAAGDPTRVVPWREWSPAKKEAWGLVNLRDPSVAAARCASCHVGNLAEGRFVTHEMFAVGHPPLPPLDLMAYSREQPRHWGLASQMPYLVNLAKKDPKKAFEVFHYRDDESLIVRRWAEGSLGTLSASADLLTQLAAQAKASNEGLDFAAFDCFSCHHDLKYPSDRQARGYEGPPGRPQFRLAPFALARVIADHAASMPDTPPLAGELDKLYRKLATSFGNKTYGDPVAIEQATGEIKAWCAAAKTKLQSVRYTHAESQKLHAKIIEAAARESSTVPAGASALQRPVADPELAQIYTWAAETLILDLAGVLDESSKLPPGFASLRESLTGSVVTQLRPGSNFVLERKPTPDQPADLVPVEARLKKRMDTFNSFRGDVFRTTFGKLPSLFEDKK